MNRTVSLACVAVGLGLAACSPTNQVSATPPSVQYRVSNNDVSQTNVQAANHCTQYGSNARLASVVNGVATYTCGPSAGPTSAAPSPVYPGTVNSPYVAPNAGAAQVQCADWAHQSRPGGSNYSGPPVPGCPQR